MRSGDSDESLIRSMRKRRIDYVAAGALIVSILGIAFTGGIVYGDVQDLKEWKIQHDAEDKLVDTELSKRLDRIEKRQLLIMGKMGVKSEEYP